MSGKQHALGAFRVPPTAAFSFEWRMLLFALLVLAAGSVSCMPSSSPRLVGDWAGILDAGDVQVPLRLHISTTWYGRYVGTLASPDENTVITLSKATVKERSMTLEFGSVRAVFKGDLSADGARLAGTWSQGFPVPLALKRTEVSPQGQPRKYPDLALSGAGVPALDVKVPRPPTPFRDATGRTLLVYELHIANTTTTAQNVTRIEVHGEQGQLASFEDKELYDVFARLQIKDPLDPRKIQPARRAVAYLWVPLANGTVPKTLRHRVVASGVTTEVAPIVLAGEKPIVIGAPLRGSGWVAGNGPSNESAHRRSMIRVDDHLVIAQRFAIDWVQARPDGSTFQGDKKRNESYYAYGAEVLAVADATVAAIKDGIPQNTPRQNSRAVSITLETIAGNHIILDLGDGRYCMYAHLQPGTLKVKARDRVKRGQVLALLGNSGNSSAPHLHFQVMDGPTPLGAEGRPYLIDSFEVLSGQYRGKKKNVLPLNGMRVSFDP